MQKLQIQRLNYIRSTRNYTIIKKAKKSMSEFMVKWFSRLGATFIRIGPNNQIHILKYLKDVIRMLHFSKD